MQTETKKPSSSFRDLAILMVATLMVNAFTLAHAQHSHPPLDEKTKAGLEACRTENHIPKRGEGERPTREQMQAQMKVLRSCMEGKGLTLPPPPERHEHHEQESVQRQEGPESGGVQ